MARSSPDLNLPVTEVLVLGGVGPPTVMPPRHWTVIDSPGRLCRFSQSQDQDLGVSFLATEKSGEKDVNKKDLVKWSSDCSPLTLALSSRRSSFGVWTNNGLMLEELD